ncbi:MAG: hypothetical protein WC551_10300 [Patescibacteria group bacterium]
MSATVLGIISSILAVIIGIWKYFGRKAAYKRDQASAAGKDIDDAIKNDDPSSFLDGFNRVRK